MGVRFLIAIEWMLTTTVALVLAHLAVEIAGATLLGYALLILLPFVGGAVVGAPVGVLQWVVLRRHIDDNGSWIGFTLLGFVAAWTGTMILAVALFAAPNGLDGFRLFLSLAIPAPIIGWSQSRVLRRWSPHTRLWVLASTVGWGGLFAVEIFRNDASISSSAGSSVELPAMLSIAQLARRYLAALALEQLLESH